MRALVLFNPGAGQGRAAVLRSTLAAALQQSGVEPAWLESETGPQLTQSLARIDLHTVDAVLVAGGDGSLHHAVNAMYQRPVATRRPLAVLPLGTGNAFARDLGLKPGEWQAGIRKLVEGQPRRFDLGRVRSIHLQNSGQQSTQGGEQGEHFEFVFCNVLGLGFVVRAARLAERCKWLGGGAYAVGALAAMCKSDRHPLRLQVDGVDWEQDALLLEVANSRFTGTDFLIAPKARLDDGLLDLVLVRPTSRRRLLRLFPSINSGQHVEAPEVEYRQARQLRILGPQAMELAPDGEFRGQTPVEIECLPGELEWIA